MGLPGYFNIFSKNKESKKSKKSTVALFKSTKSPLLGKGTLPDEVLRGDQGRGWGLKALRTQVFEGPGALNCDTDSYDSSVYI